jgi:two-component system, cell cycle sensor histidine kinase and response regulator CckA
MIKIGDYDTRLLTVALQASANAIVITDVEGSIQWVNPAFTTLTGYSADEAIGRNPRDLLRSGRHDAAFYRTLWETLLGGDVWRGTMVNRRKDGSLFTEDQTITPVLDDTGAITHFIAVKEDISPRLEVEAALAETDRRFRSLFHGVPVGLFRATPDGRLLDANATMVRMLGYGGLEELRALPMDGLYADPADRRRLLSMVEEAGEVHGEDVVVESRDGRRIWARVTMRAERDESGRTIHYEGAIEDVTARRHGEAQLRFQAQLLDAVGEAVMATDPEGRIRYWNRRAEELYGWARDEVMGRNVVDVTPSSMSRRQADEIMKRLAAGEVWTGEFQVQRRDGSTFPAEVTNTPILDEAGGQVGIVGISHDLSNRRSLEEQLRHSQKMEALGQLAGGIAHDLNNVLTAVLGHTHFLLGELEPGPLHDDANQVRRNADRAVDLVKQILAFSRKQVLNPTVLDVGGLALGVEKMLRSLVRESIVLEMIAQPGVGRIEADRGQIEQVIMNLTVNAVGAMPAGGRLTISVTQRRVDPDEAGATRDGMAAGDYAVIEVADTGHGIDPAILDRIFEPFFTTREPGTGTGLGLATVYGIVRQSAGYVGVESEKGRGTTFRVYFPPTDKASSAKVALPIRVGRNGQGERVLLVEDDKAVRALVRRVLVGAGYTVLDAGSPAEALDAAGSVQPGEIRLVITDVVMPGMSGVDLVGQLLGVHPGTPVIFMSGYAASEVLDRTSLPDGHRFLAKPFTPDNLVRAVGAALMAPVG